MQSIENDYRHRYGFPIRRGSRMRELRRDIDAALAKGWHWPLSLQRMRTLSQDERHEQAAHQALETPGKFIHK